MGPIAIFQIVLLQFHDRILEQVRLFFGLDTWTATIEQPWRLAPSSFLQYSQSIFLCLIILLG